jgi:hypothetical protein
MSIRTFKIKVVPVQTENHFRGKGNRCEWCRFERCIQYQMDIHFSEVVNE